MTSSSLIVDVGDGAIFMALGAPVERLVHPTTVGSSNVGLSIVRMAPGSVIRRHRHPYEEAYYVVEGTGVMYLETVGEVELRPGRSVYVPPNTIHGQVNTSEDVDLHIVLALSPPPPDGVIPELFE